MDCTLMSACGNVSKTIAFLSLLFWEVGRKAAFNAVYVRSLPEV